MDTITDKLCPHCQQVKPLSSFNVHRSKSGGFSSWCRDCNRNDCKARYQSLDPAFKKERAKKYRESMMESRGDEFRAQVAEKTREWTSKLRKNNPSRYRARRFFEDSSKVISPDITREYIESLFVNSTHCECCGDELVHEWLPRGERKHKTHLKAPSIDRVNNDLGYQKNNIAVVCWTCNHRKTDLTLKDLEMFKRYIERFGA